MAEKQSKSSENKKNNVPVLKENLKSVNNKVLLRVPMIHCSACGVDLPTEKSFNQHIQVKEHKKAPLRHEMQAASDSNNSFLGRISDLPVSKSTEDRTSETDVAFFCDVCKKSFPGKIPYKEHLTSATHHMNLKKEKQMSFMEDLPEVLSSKTDCEENDYDSYYPKSYKGCEICKKEFAEPEAYQQHLIEAQHRNELQLKKQVASVAEEFDLREKVREFFSYCDICDEGFRDRASYKSHTFSYFHKEAVQKVKLKSQMKDMCIQEDDKFLCKECRKPFSNLEDLQIHVNSNDHQKKGENAEKALKLLDKHPEMQLYAEEDFGVYLLCAICTETFTSTKSAWSHVLSKSHEARKALS